MSEKKQDEMRSAQEASVEEGSEAEAMGQVDVAAQESASDLSAEAAEAAQDQLQSLQTKLDEAERKAAEYLDGWQRSQASFANFRKRSEAEQESWRVTANAALLTRLLPVVDDFERAFEVMPEELKDNPWLNGMRLIYRKLQSVLEVECVQPIALEPGDAFDPMYHQAVLYQEVPGFEEGQIVAQVEKGYILGERVLRPAAVVVAKGTPAQAEAASGEAVEVQEASAEDATGGIVEDADSSSDEA